MVTKFESGEHYRKQGSDQDIFVLAVDFEDDNEVNLLIFWIEPDTRKNLGPGEALVKKSDFDKWTHLEE